MNSTIFGRVGQDAVVSQTNNGTQVANFSVALNVYAKGGDSQVTWVRATIFGNQAESLAPYLTKGTAVALSGDLKLRQFEDTRDGGTRTSLDMSVNSVALLGGGNKAESAAPRSQAPAPARRPVPAARTAQRPAPRPAPAPVEPPVDDGNYDEEVGF